MSSNSWRHWANRARAASTTALAAAPRPRRPFGSADRLAALHSVADVRAEARRRLPRVVFDFVDGGAEDESTVRGNEAAFADWWFVPRPLVDVSTRSTRTELFGRSLRAPLVVAPTGLAGLVWPHGEAVAAAAANAWGIPYTLSCAGSCSIEDVRAATAAGAPLWFQLYVWQDRALTEQLVERARRSGYEVLCLTVDVPLSGRRERDLRNGMTIPPRIGLSSGLDALRHLSWLVRFARAPVTFANVRDVEVADPGAEGGAPGSGTMALGAYVNSQLDPSASWAELRWLREQWSGPLVVKGVLDPETARRLVGEGVDGIVVSNHGGRQLDSAVPSLVALPSIVAAVGASTVVLMDGGVRRGTDIAKALALGADAALVGRPHLWGLAAGGGVGVARVLSLFEDELDRALALLGCPSPGEVRKLGGELLVRSVLGTTARP